MNAAELLARSQEQWTDLRHDSMRRARSQTLFLDIRLILPACFVWLACLVWITHGLKVFLFVLGITLLLWVMCWCYQFWCCHGRAHTLIGHINRVLLLSILVVMLQGSLIHSRGYHYLWTVMDALNGSTVRVTGIVEGSAPARDGSFRTELTTQVLTAGNDEHHVKARIFVYSHQNFMPGDRVRAVGKLAVKGTYYSVSGQAFSISSAPSADPIVHLKDDLNRYAQRIVGADDTALILGLAYGDDSSMTEQTKAEMRTAGLTHLTAVSGANITLIFVLAYRLMSRLVDQRYVLIAVGALASTAYIVVVGPDGSVLRAWVMGSVGALGLLFGHGSNSLGYLATCILGLLFYDPSYASNLGFSLSAVATGSILLLAPAMTRIVCSLFPPAVADLITMPLAASLWCAPVIMVLSDSIYAYTVLANLLAAPLVAPITLVGLLVLACYTAQVPEPILEFMLGLGQWGTSLLINIAAWVSSLPNSAVEVEASPVNLSLITSLVIVLSCCIWWADARMCRQSPQRQPRLYQGESV